jgi:hypothetical protein
MGDELSLAMRADGPQHHQGVGEGAQEGAQSDLVAAVARKVAQQPGPHLAGSQRRGSDGDREHRARHPDGGGGNRPQ